MPQPIRGMNVGRGSGAGTGPQQGMDYLQGMAGLRNPGLNQDALPINQEGSPDGVVNRVTPESGPSTGGGGYTVPEGERRDLTKDPLTTNEMYGYKGARAFADKMVPGAGLVMDYNLGTYGYNPAVDAAMRNDAMVANTYNAGRVQGSFPDSTIQDRAETAFASSKLGNWFGATSGYTVNADGSVKSPTGVTVSPISTPSWAPATPISAMEQNPEDAARVAAEQQAAQQAAQQTSMENPSYNNNGGGGWQRGYQADTGVTVGGPMSSNSISATSISGDSGNMADGGIVGLTAPRYADGGMMESPQTLAQMGFANGGQLGLGAPGAEDPQMVTMRVNEMARDPRVQQAAQRIVGAAMQSGELTPEELIQLGRIAEASLHNPQLYPQLRQFAAQNGMTTLPPSFDQRVIMTLMVASKVAGQTPPGQVPPTDVAQMHNPNGAPNGGFLQGPGTGRSDSIGTVNMSNGGPVKVANGEYVIPKHVVDAKGKEFFDKMLRQYAPLTPSEG